MTLPRRPRVAVSALEPLEVRTLLAAGDLDPSFGGDGVVDVVFSSQEALPTFSVAVERQSDGKLVVLSRVTVNGFHTPYLARFQPDGSRDWSFGDAGRVMLPTGIPRQLAVRSDDGLLVAVEAGSEVRLHRLRGDGTVDTTFAATGSRTLSGGAGQVVGLESLAGGGTLIQQGNSLFRLLADGTNDPSFDGDGQLEFGAAGEQGAGFVIQSDGRVVAVTWLTSPFRVVARRIALEGTVDSTFASGRFEGAVADFPDQHAQEATPPALAPDGSVYLPVWLQGGVIVFKLTTEGRLATDFIVNGLLLDGLGGLKTGVRAIVQPDNKLVVGTEQDGDFLSRGWVIARYLPDGRPDRTFGGTGLIDLDFADGDVRDHLLDLNPQTDGTLIGIGDSGLNGHNKGVVARLTSAGALDTTFSNDGRVFLAHRTENTFSPRYVNTSIDSTGRVLVVGSGVGLFSVDPGYDLKLARINPDGSRDTGFPAFDANDVLLDAGFTQTLDSRAVFVEPAGGVLIAGRAIVRNSLLVKTVGAVVRLNPDGTLDQTFGDLGVATIPNLEKVRTLVSLPDGKILVSGLQTGPREVRIMRLNVDGRLDSSFGNGGAAEPTRAGEAIVDLTTTSDGRIVAITTEFQFSPIFAIRIHVKRWFANGSLDRSLNGTGQVELNLNDGNSSTPLRIFPAANGRLALLTGSSGIARLSFIDEGGNIVSSAEVSPSSNVADGMLLANGGVSVLGHEKGNDPIRVGRTTPAGLIDADWTVSVGVPEDYTFEASQTALPDTRLVLARVFQRVDNPTRIELRRFLAGPSIFTTTNVPLTTTESGSTSTFDVRLSSQPTADVTIPVASSDTTEGTVSVTSLTFTPDNWSTAQSVTITGVDDALFDADQRYRILLGPATSSDADYNGMTVRPVEVRNRDDETLRFFRAYNPQANFHFFTTSVSEFQGVQPNGYNDESSGRGGFSLVATAEPGFKPLFRLYNLQKGYHYYTASVAEKDFLLSLNPPSTDPNFGKIGWRFEGSPGFIADTQQAGTNQVYRLYNKTSGAHLFTENPAVRAAVLQSTEWEEHAPLGFAFLVDDAEPLGATASPPPPVAASVPEARSTATAAREKSMPNVASLVAMPSGSRSILPAVPAAADVDGASSSAIGVGDEFDVAALDAYLESLAGELVGSDL
jgi:uncharacterized delta-60 repeat protein